MTSDPTWNFLDPKSKGRVIEALRHEADAMFELVDDAANWHVPTACEGWEVRDMVGHLVDAGEAFLSGFDLARAGADGPPPVGMAGAPKAADEAARAFRGTDQAELVARLRSKTEALVKELESLSADEWSTLMVRDPYLGPLPAMVVAAGMLGGLSVHAWDIRHGLHRPHAIDADAADLLVPFLFLLWPFLADTAGVADPYALGIRTTGHNGGDTRVEVSSAGINVTPGEIDGCAAILEADPGTLVLIAYNRVNAGTVHGDRALLADFRSRLLPL